MAVALEGMRRVYSECWEPNPAQRGEGQTGFRAEAVAMAEERPLPTEAAEDKNSSPALPRNKRALHFTLKRSTLLFSLANLPTT